MKEKTKAIFLDRDGVINYDGNEYYTYKIEDFILNEGVVEALSVLKDKGYIFIVISNQGGIGRGLYQKDDADRLHTHMRSLFAEKGIVFTEVYYCPHYPDTGNCLCRKPQNLMIEKAIARFNIDRESSYFIGDREKDEEAAKNAGIKPIRIKANESLMGYLEKIS